MKKHSIVVAVLCVLLDGDVSAATRTWSGGAGTWTDADGVPWGGTAPTTNDLIQLTQPTAGNITIEFAGNSGLLSGTETNVGERYGNLTLSNAGGGTTTLHISTGDLLPCGDGITYTASINTGGRLAIDGGIFSSRGIYDVNGGVIDQSGGLIQPVWYDMNLYSGAYNLSGGLAKFRILYVGTSSGHAVMTVSGGELNVWNNNNSEIGGGSGSGTLIQTGGVITNLCQLRINSNGLYRLEGGVACLFHVLMRGGQIIQTNTGAMTPIFDLNMALAPGETGVYRLHSGLFRVRGLYMGYNGGTGEFHQSAGTLATWGVSGAKFGGATGRGTYWLGDAAGPATYDLSADNTGHSLDIGLTGLLQGRGQVWGGGYRTLQMSGRVVADGYGTESDLALTNGFSGDNQPANADYGKRIFNDVDNTGSNGWFAVRKGRLLMPTIGGHAGNPTYYVKSSIASVYNWGESAYTNDPVIDLVNSAQIAFGGLGAGNGILSGALLATNRSDVPAPPPRKMYLSVHDFSLAGNTFTSFTLTVRYDDELVRANRLNENTVRIWQYTGGTWVHVSETIDTANRLIKSNARTAFSLFAVTADPPPSGTVIMLR